MKLTISNAPAFLLAVVCASTKGNGYFSGVRFEPDGTLAGTDGVRLAWHPHGVEPFEGTALTVKIDKVPPVGAHSIEVDTEAGTVSWLTKGGKPGIGTCSLMGDWYPDFRRITPGPGVPRVEASSFGLNAFLLADLVKYYDTGKVAGQVVLENYPGNLYRLIGSDPEQVVLLGAVRTN